LTGYLTKYLNAPSEFNHIVSAILDGLWYTDITLDKRAFLKFTYQLHGIECEYLTIIFILIIHKLIQYQIQTNSKTTVKLLFFKKLFVLKRI